ncbi:MAG TPA: hypothetical protein VGK17_15420 [Propionicimonas sp.]
MRNSADGPIQDQAVRLAIQHGNWSARQVYRELLRMNGHDPEAEPPTGFPSLRTIQRAIQRLSDDTPADEEWSMLDGSPEEARTVLHHLLAFLDLLQPARRPTRQEAELIVRIAAADPTLNEKEVCWLAVWAARGRAQRRDVEDLLGPLRHGTRKSDEDIYQRLVMGGVIDPHLPVLMFVETAGPRRPPDEPAELEEEDFELAEAAMPALEEEGATE